VSSWFEDSAKKMENDPQYIAEGKLIALTEQIWKIGKPVGIYKILFRVLEFCADKLIRRGGD